MKKFKIFVVILVVVCTIAGVLYLMAIAREMEKYTLSSIDNTCTYIVFSSSDTGFKNIPDTQKLMEYTSSLLKAVGESCSIIDISNMDQQSAEKALRRAIKPDGKYVLVDINPTKLVVSDKSLILRVSRQEENIYRENLKYAKSIKDGVKDGNLVVRIITDDKKYYYEDMCESCLRLELWDGITENRAMELISITLSPVIE